MDDYFEEIEIIAEDKFKVQYSIIPESITYDTLPDVYEQAQRKIDIINNEINLYQNIIKDYDKEIDVLTNHADGLDYMIAVSCGIISGVFDSFFVGEWDFKKAKEFSNEKVNKKVINFAKRDPQYREWLKKNRGERASGSLEDAITFLEKKYPLPGDGTYNVLKGSEHYETLKNITHKTHHLDDFCHHPTLIGLLCCIIVQFTGHTLYCDRSGTFINNIPLTVNDYGNFVGKNPITKLFSGIINWFINIARTAANQKGHLYSDMANSAGIPGSFLSTLKELAALPCFRDTNFNDHLRKAFQNGIGDSKNQINLGVFNCLFEGASSKFDLRTEMAFKHQIKKQAIPVVLNEILVRSAYFIRRFIAQIKEFGDLSKLNWKELLPFKNRTIIRMLTISTGSFVTVDLADAAIHSAIKNMGNAPAFAKSFVLRVNFVGIGRFAVSVVSDCKMAIDKKKKSDKRMIVYNQLFSLYSTKLIYKQAQIYNLQENIAKKEEKLWLMVLENERVHNELLYLNEIMPQASIYIQNENKKDLETIGKMRKDVESKNPGLIEDILNEL